MPRKDLLNDFSKCQTEQFADIIDLRYGTDGTFTFSYQSDSLPTGVVNIEVMVPEPYDYPTRHQYMLFLGKDENAPLVLASALEHIGESASCKPFKEMLEAVSIALHRSLNYGKASNPIKFDEENDTPAEETNYGGAEDLDFEFDDFDGEEQLSDDEEDAWAVDEPAAGPQATIGRKSVDLGCTRTTAGLPRARADLRLARLAGFKVGVLGDLRAGGFVCVSIRIVKLGISEEAMQAWGLHRRHYLVLMIRFGDGYRTLTQVSEMANLAGRTEIRVALCKHYKPTFEDALLAFTTVKEDAQPTKSAARQSPQDSSLGEGNTPPPDGKDTSLLETVFIGRPLNDLLRSRFPGIVKYRLACGFKWTGAELYFNDNQGKGLNGDSSMDERYYVEDNTSKRALPSIVTADSIDDDMGGGETLSLPLVAMQFLLRHFVRCTEFCLVCHCGVGESFEALRPYVCSKPLCLYQYMSLGFGPSIEWEILSQPYVVDLLVSFCYVSARQGRLEDFPVGISLNVPILPHFVDFNRPNHFRGHMAAPAIPVVSPAPRKSFDATYDQSNKELVIHGDLKQCPVKIGDWLVLQSKINLEGYTHCRVEDARHFPVISIGDPIAASGSMVENSDYYANQYGCYSGPPQPAPTPVQSPKVKSAGSFEVECFLYDKVFDLLSDDHKRQSICVLLDTLPDINNMRTYLEARPFREPSLRACNKISESTLNLLRWIIASNRSCILQIDRTLDKHMGIGLGRPPVARTASIGGTEDRVSGMEGWMQFRFAQGAPDKEQRFIDCVNDEAKKCPMPTKYPTIFAWHGSPLSNWHSIIREGLHFKETAHGRAYGNGVYMSPQATTSMGYSQMYGAHGAGYSGPANWTNSVLRISTALSLNEVVNSPKDFVSRSPHYVVNQVDWIQTRYLFVKASTTAEMTGSGRTLATYEQDPSAIVSGEKGAITIPITAVSKSRRPAMSADAQRTGLKKAKHVKATDQLTAEKMEDDANSVLSDNEDRAFLESDDDEDDDYNNDDYNNDEDVQMVMASEYPLVSPGVKRTSDVFRVASSTLPIISASSRTDFVPGSLDISTIKMLKPPGNASSSTTKILMRTLQDVLVVQASTPLHELGWYIDSDIISNMYQWVVELHSFDPTLPLAKDMKQSQITSIVLEFRFTNSFPFSPPFVRVVRPRFLAFMAGGGGHVTQGGAICMQLLTNDGWMVTSTIESVLLQIRMAISDTEHPARLGGSGRYGIGGGSGGGMSYGVGEAIEAYKRACAAHGWTVPKDFDTMQKE